MLAVAVVATLLAIDLISGPSLPAAAQAAGTEMGDRSIAAAQMEGLVGPEWHWRGTLMNDDTAFIPTDPTSYTVMFLADGTVGVRADCNRANGTYTTSGDEIEIQLLTMTQAFCPPPSLSNTFVQQLGQVSRYSVRGLELVLQFPFDSGSMGFAAPLMGESPPTDTEGGDVAALESTPWTLVEYASPDGSTLTVIPNTEITATFQAGRLTGSAGCNSYAGGYTVSGSSLSLTQIIGTLRFCLDPAGLMEQESAYVAALGRVTSFAAAPEALTLYADDGATLMSYVPQTQTSLEGTLWQALDYNNGRGAVTSVLAGTEITALFDAGSLSGSAGCNRYSATYTLDGTAISIGPAASTRLACGSPPGIMEQEAEYLTALTTAASYRIEGNRLFLERADGARVASFIPASETGLIEAGADVAQVESPKITFDLTLIDEAGLMGPPGGQVAVAYEFCVPATPAYLAEVQRIDPTVQAQPGAPGRIGCGPGEVLYIGSTYQPNWQTVLHDLAGLDYVTRIDRFVGE